MGERDFRANEDIRLPTLGGLNQRPSPANLRPGEFSHLEGLYPAQIGLLRRIPGKTFSASVTGKVLSIHPTYNATGDVLFQTDAGLFVYTLDELRSRASTPALTFTPISEEETMSMAIIVQREANAINGGSIQGFMSGVDGTAAIDTWYPRRLTNRLVDSDSIITTFTAAGSGAGAASSGSFVLSPGTYRISAWGTFRSESAATVGTTFAMGLYNSTSGSFEVYTGGSDPIVSTIVAEASQRPSGSGSNRTCVLEGEFVVSSTNKTYELRQKCSVATEARSNRCCGFGSNLSGSTGSTTGVNGAALQFTYAFIKILKVA